MKNLISWRTFVLAPALFVLYAAAARAEAPVVRVDIPFAFTAGNRVLPAGEYRFAIDADHLLSRITPVNGGPVCTVRLVPGTSDRSAAKVDKGMVRFEKYGERYLLTGIWKAGWSAGNAVVASRPPREYVTAGKAADLAATR